MIGIVPWPGAFEVPQRKITHYLLDVNHADGGPKARFFYGFGYDRTYPDVLADALRSTATIDSFQGVVLVRGGLRYCFEASVDAPDGRRPEVFTVWQLDTAAVSARLITARPKR